MKEIILEGGDKYTYSELNWTQQTEIIDLHQEMYHKGLPLSLQLCSKIMVYSRVCTQADLNNSKYEIEQVYNIGAKLLEAILQPVVDKKKLK